MEQKESVQSASSEERFINLLENLQGIAIQGYRLDGTTTYWNEASERLYGYTAPEALGRNLLDLIIPEELTKQIRTSMERMVTSGRPLPAVELILKKKDGSQVPVFSNHALVQLKGAEPELFCLDIDLSERRKAEMEREQMTAQIRQLHKAESLNRMAAAIAHHFNNQLTAVLCNLEMILEDLPIDMAQTRELADAAMRAAHRATDISTLLLTYLGQTVSQKVLFDLTSLCRRNMDLLQNFLPTGITVIGTFPQEETMIHGNPEQIQQLLANLFVNAREAIGKESGIIRITVEIATVPDAPKRLRVPIEWQPAEPDTVYAVLTVSDDGCGIDDNDLDKIFDPFFSSKLVGRGMGLSTVLGIAKLHNGAISVDSRLGRGSTFQVFLPLTTPRAIPTCE